MPRLKRRRFYSPKWTREQNLRENIKAYLWFKYLQTKQFKDYNAYDIVLRERNLTDTEFQLSKIVFREMEERRLDEGAAPVGYPT